MFGWAQRRFWGSLALAGAGLAVWLVMLALGGCATNPEGSNWALADFNKYGRNYAPFPTDRLQIGEAFT